MILSNTDYDSLMREYEETRDRHRREQEERIAAAEAKLPELAALSDELRRISMTAARQKLADPSADTGWLSAKTALLLARKRQLLLSNGFSADELSLRFDCPYCQDTGYTNARPCRCLRKKIALRLSRGLEGTGTVEPADFSHFSYDWYSDTIIDKFSGKTERWLAREAVQRALAFTENIGQPGNNLLIYGNVGVGKTYLLHCIAQKLLEDGHPVFYFDAGGLFNLLADAAFRRNGHTADEATAIIHSPVLLIDDLGTEYTNAFVGTELFRILNEREHEGLSTVVSSNLDLNGIGERYSERVSSRLMENIMPIRMVADDIRIQKKLSGL